MGFCRFVFFFICNWLYVVACHAQENVFQRITRQQGIPSDYVTALYFDSSGVCWIGTDRGMCRYDGLNIQVLDADNGLGGNFVNAFMETGLNRVWVGTVDGGLTEVQYRNGKLYPMRRVYPQQSVISINLDEQGNYWVVTTNEDHRGFVFWQTTDLDKAWTRIVSCKEKGRVVVDTSGNLWYDRNGDLEWHNPYRTKIAANDKFPGQEIKYLASSGHRVCIATAESLHFLDARTTQLKYKVAYQFPHERPAAMGYLATPDADFIYRISNGASISYGNKADAKNYIDRTSLSMAFTMACDRNGTPYVSDFGKGILVWQRPYMKQFETRSQVKRIAFQGNKTSFCTEDMVYSVTENNYSQYFPAAEKIHFIAATDSERFFVSGHNKLILNGKALTSPHETFYDFSDVVAVGGQFFISSYSFGLLRWANGAHDYNWKSRNLPVTMLERLSKARDKLFALTLNDGLFELDTAGHFNRSYTRQKGLLSNCVFDVLADKDTLWVATNLGLNAACNDSIIQLSNESGFIGSRAISVFRDWENRLWVLSDKYLHHYASGRLFALRSFPVLPDERAYISTAKYNQVTNTLWIGMNRMAIAVDMSAVRPSHTSHIPELAFIRLGEAEYSQIRDNISLTYNHEPLQIGLANSGINLLNPPEMYYRFKGLNDAWTRLEKDLLIRPNRFPPGTFVLEAKSEGPDYGSASPRELLTITVSSPWWKQFWFLLLSVMVAAAIAFAIGALYNKRRYKARLQALKAAQAVELERTRISRELHDNVGSMLTLMVNRVNDEPQRRAEELGLDEIARNTLSQLRDAIWALDQKDLTLAQWNARTNHFLRQVGREGLSDEGIFTWPGERKLSPIEALHIFRIVQESCTNAIRHGKATSIKVTGRSLSNDCLELLIEDNGRGFDIENTPMGYGLRNIKKRAMDLNGQLLIESDVNAGTRIRFTWCPGEKNTPYG